MNETGWDRVRRLFDAAIDEQPADLVFWLSAREPDANVRREVASLLDHHARAGAFLERSTAASLLAIDETDDGTGLAAGTPIGPYTIVREIGRGGMGRVYLAADTRLGRPVAIKTLPPHATRDPIARERLRREARAAARLSHPGICAVHALEEHGDDVSIVSEYVEGRTLQDAIDAGERPSASDLSRAIAELGSALAAAHAGGVIHRDLKPSNIIRAADGRLKILDFGIARITDGAPDGAGRFTGLDALAGTPTAMAPEQIDGRAVDARTDLFALGLVLYEYASGVHPFAGRTPLAVIGRILEGEPAPLADARPDLAPPLPHVIHRCLRKDPADRFSSADELLAALRDTAAPVDVSGGRFWWRVHQLVMLVLYFLTAAAAWQMKEWQRAWILLAVFLAVSAATAAAGVLRGHLLFEERWHPAQVRHALQREGGILMRVDLTIAGLALGGAFYVAVRHPLAAAVIMGLSIGIGISALSIEPSTTKAAFPR